MQNGDSTARFSSALLLGKDHTELGRITIAEPANGVAIGISRGRFPKGYPSVDPNEDAVYAATDGTTCVLAVADGHRGTEASHAAVEGIVAAAWPIDGESTEQSVRRLLGSAIEEVAATLPSLPEPRRSSRTSLTVAVARADRVAAATVGDTSCHIVGRRRVTRMGGATEFLSGTTDPSTAQVDSASVPPGGTIVLASDGVSDFTGDMSRLLRSASHFASRDCVERIVDAAFSGGAGDNISVAVMRRA